MSDSNEQDKMAFEDWTDRDMVALFAWAAAMAGNYTGELARQAYEDADEFLAERERQKGGY